MIKTILAASGIPHRQGRFLSPPAATYAVYFDSQEASGADPIPGAPKIIRHDCTVELYEPKADLEAETALEEALDAQGLEWTKQDRYWLSNVQRYQVIYEFSYNEKRRT